MDDPNKKIGHRPTWAEVDLDNLAYNFNVLKKLLSPGTKVMVCVKADAYGHGLVPVSRKLEAQGVDFLAVASVDEGIRLREAGISCPILILGLVLKQEISPLFEYDLTATVCTEDLAHAIDNRAGMLGRIKHIHVKVDTGMARIGVDYDQAFSFIKKVNKLRNIKIEGVFTHLACADIDIALTKAQIASFDRLISRLRDDGINIELVHAANSMGVIAYRGSHFNMVRPGLAIYGLYPKSPLKIRLKPVLSLKTRVIYSKEVKKGTGISYGHTYVTRKKTRIVTLPIGYGDGYPRILSNRGPVLLGGRRFKISGRICMDQMMVDVGSLYVKVAQEAVLIGRQNKKVITAEELAWLSDTIPYEIVCGLGSRVPRIYLEKTKAHDIAERRIDTRQLRKLPMRFTDIYGDINEPGFTEDISTKGISLLTNRRLCPEQGLVMSLRTKDDKGWIYTKGKVVWAQQRSDNSFRAGVSLDRPDLTRLCKG